MIIHGHVCGGSSVALIHSRKKKDDDNNNNNNNKTPKTTGKGWVGVREEHAGEHSTLFVMAPLHGSRWRPKKGSCWTKRGPCGYSSAPDAVLGLVCG